MKCNIYCGPPGGGKTLQMLGDAISSPGRYLIVTARKELHSEFMPHFEGCPSYGTGVIPITSIHSGQSEFREGVFRRVEDALKKLAEAPSCVLFITHEGLLGINPALLAGWHVRIDEVPDNAVVSNTIEIGASFASLEKHFELEHLGENLPWSRVAPLRGSKLPSTSAWMNDTAKLGPFVRLATNSHRLVFVDLAEWQDAQHQKVRYWSIWTPIDVQSCASLSITGASFFSSLVYRACRKFHADDLQFQTVRPPLVGPRAKPPVTIRYFTRHRATTDWWGSDEGSLCLVRISQYLEREAFSGFWSCNASEQKVFRHRFPEATMCSPKQAGTNSLRDRTSCAFIYSNKAQIADSAIMEILDLTSKDIVQTREQEDIVQFVMRGAIRDATYDGPYDIYLYNQEQAEALSEYLRDNAITDRVQVVPVEDAGIMNFSGPKPRVTSEKFAVQSTTSVRKRQERTRERDRLRAERKRDAERQVRKANGSYRGRGRPKKVKSSEPPAA